MKKRAFMKILQPTFWNTCHSNSSASNWRKSQNSAENSAGAFQIPGDLIWNIWSSQLENLYYVFCEILTDMIENKTDKCHTLLKSLPQNVSRDDVLFTKTHYPNLGPRNTGESRTHTAPVTSNGWACQRENQTELSLLCRNTLLDDLDIVSALPRGTDKKWITIGRTKASVKFPWRWAITKTTLERS